VWTILFAINGLTGWSALSSKSLNPDADDGWLPVGYQLQLWVLAAASG
jgi:hypothetical protein